MHVLWLLVCLVLLARSEAAQDHVQTKRAGVRSDKSPVQDLILEPEGEVDRSKYTFAWTERSITPTEDYETYVRLDVERGNSARDSKTTVGTHSRKGSMLALRDPEAREIPSHLNNADDITSESIVRDGKTDNAKTPNSSQDVPGSDVVPTQSESPMESHTDGTAGGVDLSLASGSLGGSETEETIEPMTTDTAVGSERTSVPNGTFPVGKLPEQEVPALISMAKLQESWLWKLLHTVKVQESQTPKFLALGETKKARILGILNTIGKGERHSPSGSSLSDGGSSGGNTSREFKMAPVEVGGSTAEGPVGEILASPKLSLLTDRPEKLTGALGSPPAAPHERTSTTEPAEEDLGAGTVSASVGDHGSRISSPSEVGDPSPEVSAPHTETSNGAPSSVRVDPTMPSSPRESKRHFKDLGTAPATAGLHGSNLIPCLRFEKGLKEFKRSIFMRVARAFKAAVRIKHFRLPESSWHRSPVPNGGPIVSTPQSMTSLLPLPSSTPLST